MSALYRNKQIRQTPSQRCNKSLTQRMSPNDAIAFQTYFWKLQPSSWRGEVLWKDTIATVTNNWKAAPPNNSVQRARFLTSAFHSHWKLRVCMHGSCGVSSRRRTKEGGGGECWKDTAHHSTTAKRCQSMQRGRQSVLKIWENVKPATTLRELLQLFALRPKQYSSRGDAGRGVLWKFWILN